MNLQSYDSINKLTLVGSAVMEEWLRKHLVDCI